MKVLVWVQHLLGIGHLRRAQALTDALAAMGAKVTVLQGGFDVPGTGFPNAQVIALPALRAADAGFSGLADAQGDPPGEALWSRRTEIALKALQEIQPGALVTESFPFGRRAFRAELLPLLEAAHRMKPRPAIVASVRDVLVAKNSEKKERWMAETARRFYDQVIVHGDPEIIPFGATFPYVEQLGNLLFYSGYIGAGSRGPAAEHKAGGTDIIVSGGGGAVSAALYGDVLAALELVRLPGARWRLLAGPDLPAADRRTLLARTSRMTVDVQIEPAVPDLAACLAGARLSISQGGYNTVMDVLSSGVPALVVPFSAGGESEQQVRAEALAGRGRLSVLSEADASRPAVLAGAIADALRQPPPEPVSWPMDGAETSAQRILSLAEQVRP